MSLSPWPLCLILVSSSRVQRVSQGQFPAFLNQPGYRSRANWTNNSRKPSRPFWSRAARLFDQHPTGGDVPGVKPAFPKPFHPTGRNTGHVDRGRTEPSHPCAVLKILSTSADIPPCVHGHHKESQHQQRLFEAVDGGAGMVDLYGTFLSGEPFPASNITWTEGVGNPGGAVSTLAPSDDRTTYFSNNMQFPAAMRAEPNNGLALSFDLSTIHADTDVFFASTEDISVLRTTGLGSNNAGSSSTISSPRHPRPTRLFTLRDQLHDRARLGVFGERHPHAGHQEQIDGVLANATSLIIRGEYWSSPTPIPPSLTTWCSSRAPCGPRSSRRSVPRRSCSTGRPM